ncbi:MAG: glycosyltransferase family 2 protein [Bacteroidales bacterium]|nr:glycosyltransferase family 2 protein [Bacteroidales bacterium]
MQNQVTLSIVMPVFNHTEDLKTMLDSILDNFYQDWELLAVDDGSDEETKEVLKQYATQDKRINIIQRVREPKGAQTCRNTGFELAQGEYIVFFDSDDYVAPYCLEQRVKELSKHPELDFMVFRSGTYYDNAFHQEPDKLNYGYQIYNDDIEAFCSRTLPFIVWNNIYRRTSLLKRNISWDTHLLSLQDAQFNLECILSGMHYAYSTLAPDYGYRTASTGSVSKQILSAAHFESNLYATKRFYSLIQQRYRHRYDHALYRGAMFLYVKVSRTGFHKDYNLHLASLIQSLSPLWGNLFRWQMRLTHFLCKIMPLTPARRLPILNYLLWYRRMEQEMVKRQKKLL